MCDAMTDQASLADFVNWLVPILLPAAAGFGGVLVGAWLTSQRDQRQRQLAFLEKQLASFYSPLLGLRNEVRAQSRLRLRIQSEASAAWADISAESEQLGSAFRHAIAEREREFARIIEYDNDKLRKDLLPAYTEMLRVFRENYWLANAETRTFYEPLVEFVEVWNRWTAHALPPEVFMRLDHSEANLDPFYSHLETTHNAIRAKIEAGTP
jgi:hypothetical protein